MNQESPGSEDQADDREWYDAEERFLDELHRGLRCKDLQTSGVLDGFEPLYASRLTETAVILNALSDSPPDAEMALPCVVCRAREFMNIAGKTRCSVCGHDQSEWRYASNSARYEEIRFLGRGSFGKVRLARDKSLDRVVAIKSLAPDVAQSIGRHQLILEARAAAGLDHPNIVPVYDVLLEEHDVGFVMSYVEGIPLSEFMEYSPNIEHREVVGYIHACAQALEYAHKKDVIHRDIKPANIMLEMNESEGGITPRIVDFGLSSIEEKRLSLSQRPAGFIGTPMYRSPEQWNGEAGDQASDVYSLGCVMLEWLFGQKALEARAAKSRVLRLSDSIAGDQHERELLGICRKATATKRQDRFADCGEFGKELARWLAGEPLKSTAQPVTRRLALKWQRDPKAFFWPIVSSIMIILAVMYGTNQAKLRSLESKLKEREIGLKEEAVARKEEAIALKEEALALQLEADQSYEIATDTISSFVSTMTNGLKGVPNTENVNEAVLSNAVDAFRKIVKVRKAPLGLGQAHFQLAYFLERQGEAEEAIQNYRQALSQFELEQSVESEKNQAKTLTNLGTRLYYSDEKEEGLKLVRDALSKKQELVDLEPGNQEFQRLLAGSYNDIGELERMEGDSSAALTNFEKGIKILDGMYAADAKAGAIIRNEEELEALNYRCTTLAKLYQNKGVVLYLLQKYDDSVRELRKAVQVLEDYQAWAPEEAKEVKFRETLGVVSNTLGAALSMIGDIDGAIESLDRAGHVNQRLHEENPGNPAFYRRVADWHRNVSEILWGQEKQEQSIERLRKAVLICEELVEEHSRNVSFWLRLIEYQHDLAGYLSAFKSLDEARNLHLQSVASLQEFRNRFPGDNRADELAEAIEKRSVEFED